MSEVFSEKTFKTAKGLENFIYAKFLGCVSLLDIAGFFFGKRKFSWVLCFLPTDYS